MKALLVTSQVTFIPENYDDLVCGLASSPQIGGLLVLQNRSIGLLKTGVGLMLLGARRTGSTLLGNTLPFSKQRRIAAYISCSKQVWTASSINEKRTLKIIHDHGFDLVINARTRDIYRTSALQAPAMGCINIHHGLLPGQRGTMCDLWALYEDQPAGFSIHTMSEKVDDGPILYTETVAEPGEFHYPNYLQKAAKRERIAINNLLQTMETCGKPEGRPNRRPQNLVFRRNPTKKEISRFRKKGMLL